MYIYIYIIFIVLLFTAAKTGKKYCPLIGEVLRKIEYFEFMELYIVFENKLTPYHLIFIWRQ